MNPVSGKGRETDECKKRTLDFIEIDHAKIMKCSLQILSERASKRLCV